MKKDKWIYESKHIIFYWIINFDISFEICGYFDNRPRIILGLFFFRLVLIFPFKNKWADECNCPKWGIAIHNNTLWVYRGGNGNLGGGNKWWTWDIPFFTKKWIRTSILLKDNTWVSEYPHNRKNFYEKKWKDKQKKWEYIYTDSFDGTKIPTTIYLEEREWRPKWLEWTKIFATINRTIDVHFSKEVGRKKNTWKGGVLGCGYNLLKNESPLECIKRMENNCKF